MLNDYLEQEEANKTTFSFDSSSHSARLTPDLKRLLLPTEVQLNLWLTMLEYGSF